MIAAKLHTNFLCVIHVLQARVIHAFGYLKRACAEVNAEHYGMDRKVADSIVKAATEVCKENEM